MLNKMTTTHTPIRQFVERFYAERIEPSLKQDVGPESLAIVKQVQDEFKDALIPASCILDLARYATDQAADRIAELVEKEVEDAHEFIMRDSTSIEEALDRTAEVLAMSNPENHPDGAVAKALVQFVRAFAIQPAVAEEPEPCPTCDSIPPEPIEPEAGFGDRCPMCVDETPVGIPSNLKEFVDILDSIGIPCTVTNKEDGSSYGNLDPEEGETVGLEEAIALFEGYIADLDNPKSNG